MALDICPYIGLGIPLCGLSNFCVMFLGVPPVISTLGNPQGKYFLGGEVKGLHFAKKPPIWEPPKSIKAGAPTVFSLAHPDNTESLFPHLRCGWIIIRICARNGYTNPFQQAYGRSKKVCATHGVIFRQGFEHFSPKQPIWEPPKSIKAGAPTVFSFAHLGNTESLFPHL